MVPFDYTGLVAPMYMPRLITNTVDRQEAVHRLGVEYKIQGKFCWGTVPIELYLLDTSVHLSCVPSRYDERLRERCPSVDSMSYDIFRIPYLYPHEIVMQMLVEIPVNVEQGSFPRK